MPMHLSERQIDLYHRRALAADELLALDDHIAECSECRERLASGEPLDPAFSSWRSLLDEESSSKPADNGSQRRHHPLAPRPRRLALLAAAALAALALGFLAQSIYHRAIARRAKTLIALSDSGRHIALRTGGRVVGVGDLPADWRHLVAATLTSGTLVQPGRIEPLQAPSAILRGKVLTPELVLLSPLATVVRSDRPRFRWSPLAGARDYRVTVVDGTYRRVAASGPVTVTEWTPAATLARGGVYSWQVEARRDGAEILAPAPPAAEARFEVLGASEEAEMERAEHLPARSHLLVAVLAARAGLTEEADRELAALALENPGSALVSRLRTGLVVGPPPQVGAPASSTPPVRR